MTANARNADPLDSAMRNARTVVLAVFNRFGDGVISGVVCEEFAKKWSFISFMIKIILMHIRN